MKVISGCSNRQISLTLLSFLDTFSSQTSKPPKKLLSILKAGYQQLLLPGPAKKAISHFYSALNQTDVLDVISIHAVAQVWKNKLAVDITEEE